MRAFDCLHTYARVDRQKSKRYCRSYACVLELCVQLPRVWLVFSVVCLAVRGGFRKPSAPVDAICHAVRMVSLLMLV